MSFVQTAESGGMSKQAMRDEAERLVKEALERKNLVVKQGKTRIEAKCRKCGAPNRVSAEQGETPRGLFLQGMRREAGDALIGARCVRRQLEVAAISARTRLWFTFQIDGDVSNKQSLGA